MVIHRQPQRQGWVYRMYRYFYPKQIEQAIAQKWARNTSVAYGASAWMLLGFITHWTLIRPYAERIEKQKEMGIDISTFS